MARIRTIKPEFFTSEDIVNLSPLARLLYIALWCEADREGRMAWKPKTFKMRYLPGDSCNVEKLCSELLEAGLIVQYGQYAFIPAFHAHQHINPREAASQLPEPDLSTETTRQPRVTDASTQDLHAQVGREGKGKEGKGKEGNELSAPKSRSKTQYPVDFLPNDSGMAVAAAKGVDVARELEKFRDYHLAKGSTMADWQAAWRTWVGNARPAPAKQETFAERDARLARERYEEFTGKRNTVIDITPAGAIV